MFPVANDFAAIAKRLKEIQEEAAKEQAAKADRQAGDGLRPNSEDVLEDAATCA